METKSLVVVVWAPEAGAAEKKVLVLRLVPSRGAFWQTVSGHVEDAESYAAAALREAREETGLHFEREPQYLGLEQEFPSRHGGNARERAFFLPLFGGPAPPEPSLGDEHDAWEWLSPAEAAARVKFDFNRKAIERAATGLAPLLLTKRGSFYQDGEEITHERTAELFHRALAQEKDGGWTVKCEGETLDVILEDSPRYVRSFDRESGSLLLTDGTREVLDPASLRIRRDNSLICTLKNGWQATFLSPAYYEISKDVRELGPAKYVLHFQGSDHKLLIAGQREWVDR